MYKYGFIPNEYVIGVICENNMKRKISAKRNYQRMIYESVENDTEFEVMIDDEIREIIKFNRFACRSS